MMWTRRDDAVYDRMAGDEYEERIAAAKRRNADLDRAEDERIAKAKAEADRRAKEMNDKFAIREYAAAGVQPVQTDADGVPTVSLETLRSLGWTIEPAFGGGNVLVPPQIKWEE